MKKIILIICALAPLAVFAQSLDRQVIGSTGGFNTASGISVSSTVGEAVVQTYSSGTIVLTQGFQQPDSTILIGIRDITSGLSINAYPNPTAGMVILEFNSSQQIQISIQVYDALGKLTSVPVESLTVNGTLKHEINMAALAAGNYFLKVSNTSGTFQKAITIQKVD